MDGKNTYLQPEKKGEIIKFLVDGDKKIDETAKVDVKVKVESIKTDKPIIKVIGVGGAGGNAVKNMYNEGIEGVDFIIANTDKQVLAESKIAKIIHLGGTLTEGLGAGNDPETGKNAAIESSDEIEAVLDDTTKMVFVTAGMGGGTGTGAAPVIAKIAKEKGILTIGIVTIPFRFEGKLRLSNAYKGLKEMEKYVDSLLIINNQKLSELYKDYSVDESFKKADQVLTSAARSIADIIVKAGWVNVDFADVKSVLKNSGTAVMSSGFGKGENRAMEAVKKAIESPLLNNNDILGAEKLLVNVYSPVENKFKQFELDDTNSFLQQKAGGDANIIWGITYVDELESDQLKVTVLASGFKKDIIPTLEEMLTPSRAIQKKKEDNEPDWEKIKKKIRQKPKRTIDYEDENKVNEIIKRPAYLRADITMNMVRNNNGRFFDPRVD